MHTCLQVLGSAALSGDWTVATLIEEIQAAAEEGEVRKKALNGKTIVFTTDENATSLFVRLSDQEETPPGQVVIADTETCAGTVQVIDAVMLPDDEIPGQEVAAAPGPASFSDDPLASPLDPATDLAAPVPSGLNGTSNSTVRSPAVQPRVASARAVSCLSRCPWPLREMELSLISQRDGDVHTYSTVFSMSL